MTFIWLILGIGLIYLLARYNESNGLFWKLLISFLIGFAACDIVLHSTAKHDEDQLTQVCPTQVSVDDSGYAVSPLAELFSQMATDESSNPVSKDYTPNEREFDSPSSEVYGLARGQPHSAMFYDDT